MPRVSVLVSPRVGPIDDEEVVRLVLGALAAGPSFRKMMAATLAEAQTLSVERAEPYVTDVGKVPALHKVR